MHAKILARIRLECLAHHQRAEIGSTNADVDDVGDSLAGVSFMFAVSHCVREGAHQPQHASHIRHDVFSINQHRTFRTVTQSGVQRSASFGRVDLVSVEHVLNTVFQLGLFGKFNQEFDGVLIDAIFRVIEQQIAQPHREFVEARRIVQKHLAHVERFDSGLVKLERMPRRRFGQV